MRLLPIVVAVLVAGCGSSASSGNGGKNQNPGGTGWAQTSGFPIDIGTTNAAILAHGPNVYVGTNGGLVATPDDGGSWKTLTNGFPTAPSTGSLPFFTGLGSTEDVILAATSDTVYRSGDEGASWTASGDGLPDDAYVRVFFATKTAVLAGMSTESNNPNKQSTVFRSTDDGKSWAIADPSPDFYVTSFAAQGGTLYAACLDGVGKSTDDGQTWNVSDLPFDPASIVVSGSTLLVSSSTGQVVSSDDQGKSWNPATNGLQITSTGSRTILLANAGDVYATHGGHAYVSHDAGGIWSELGSGLSGAPDVTALTLHGQYLFAMSKLHGVWRLPLQ